jgi:carbonic anhydrase/acetyltransferase-like protein (isoleucine patch superfamily)
LDRPPPPLIGSHLGRRPELARSCWIAPGCHVIGEVEIGEEASLWYGTVVRGDVERIRVGARSNIQDNSTLHVTRDLHPCEIGADVTVGHRAVVHGCRVGDGALIGIGAVVLDGAEIGENAWVGAGATVTPGAVIESGMLAIGTPARCVRRLTAEEIRTQQARTVSYVGLAREHHDAGLGLMGAEAGSG